jgi:hypothetical protein
MQWFLTISRRAFIFMQRVLYCTIYALFILTFSRTVSPLTLRFGTKKNQMLLVSLIHQNIGIRRLVFLCTISRQTQGCRGVGLRGAC